MRVRILDDGLGFPASQNGEGVGLGNTRKMLDRLYGETLEIRPLLPHGTEVSFAFLPDTIDHIRACMGENHPLIRKAFHHE